MREPIDIRLPVEQQIEQIFARAYLAECNRAYARKFGHETPELLVGASLSALLDATDEKILHWSERLRNTTIESKGWSPSRSCRAAQSAYF